MHHLSKTDFTALSLLFLSSILSIFFSQGDPHGHVIRNTDDSIFHNFFFLSRFQKNRCAKVSQVAEIWCLYCSWSSSVVLLLLAAVWITHSTGSLCPSVKGGKPGPGVMLQDKPAPRKAPLIILLFGNGALCLQNTGQSISYSKE